MSAVSADQRATSVDQLRELRLLEADRRLTRFYSQTVGTTPTICHPGSCAVRQRSHVRVPAFRSNTNRSRSLPGLLSNNHASCVVNAGGTLTAIASRNVRWQTGAIGSPRPGASFLCIWRLRIPRSPDRVRAALRPTPESCASLRMLRQKRPLSDELKRDPSKPPDCPDMTWKVLETVELIARSYLVPAKAAQSEVPLKSWPDRLSKSR